jgi:TonB family protein
MSAEPRQVTNTEAWVHWEGQFVNGIFPLRRCLDGSSHSAVFLTEYRAENIANAAIKLVPVDAQQAEAQLSQWRTAAALSHPHLIRIFDVGRWQFGGREVLFVVMEHAEQTLAQILRRRALSLDETQDLLLPTLDVVAFLHRNHLVHGQLRPSNFLAVGDQLKLTRDGIRPVGDSASGIRSRSSYDPPELQERGFSTAGDIWSLGVTVVEALTQRVPAWSDEQSATTAVPATLPAAFADVVRRCLRPAPAERPTASELEAQFKPAPQVHSLQEPPPLAREAPREVTAPPSSPKLHPLLLTIAAALLLSLLVWAGLRLANTSQTDLQLPAIPAPAPAAPSAAAQPVSQPPVEPAPAPTAASPSVLLEAKPEVPRAILDKIQGRVLVTVRVLVDPSGNVIGALLEDPGSSKYFARVANEAAREWKFVAADSRVPRVWLLRFAFTREGVTTRVIAV